MTFVICCLIKTVTNTYSNQQTAEFIQCFGAASLCSRRGSLAEQAALLRFQPGTRGYHREFERLTARRAALQETLQKQMQTHLQKAAGLTLAVFDDTPIRKTGKQFEGQTWQYDHTNNTYYNGFTACSTVMYRGGKMGVVQTKCSKQQTKIAMFNDAIASLCQEPLAPDVFLFDAWYALKPVLSTIDERGKAYVTKLKSNLLVNFTDEKRSLRELSASIVHEQYTNVAVHNKTRWVVDTELMLNSGLQRILICKDHVFAKPIFLATNSRTFSTKQVLLLYEKRFCIETFFKDAKQYLNLSTFQCKSREKWETHFLLVQLLHWCLQRRHSISKIVRSVWDNVSKATSYINGNSLFRDFIEEFSKRCQT